MSLYQQDPTLGSLTVGEIDAAFADPAFATDFQALLAECGVDSTSTAPPSEASAFVPHGPPQVPISVYSSSASSVSTSSSSNARVPLGERRKGNVTQIYAEGKRMEKGCTLCVAAGDPCVRHPKYKNCGKCTLWGKTCSLNPECPAFRHNSMMSFGSESSARSSVDSSDSEVTIAQIKQWLHVRQRHLEAYYAAVKAEDNRFLALLEGSHKRQRVQ